MPIFSIFRLEGFLCSPATRPLSTPTGPSAMCAASSGVRPGITATSPRSTGPSGASATASRPWTSQGADMIDELGREI